MAQAEKTIDVNVPLAFFYDIICDFEAYPTFSKDVETAVIEERDGDNVTALFTVKVLRRRFDYRLAFVLASDTEVSWTLVDSSTLAQNDGGWRLEAIDAQTTRVTYWNELAAKLFLPKTFINGVVKLALPNMLKQWRRHAETSYTAAQTATDA